MSYVRRTCVLALSIFVLTITFASSAFSQNIVINGGFEEGALAPANGWTTHNANTTFNGWTVGPANSVDVHNGEPGFSWNRPDQGGYQSLDLNGTDASSVSQLLPTGTGKYKLSFYMAGNLACGSTTKILQVSLGGQVIPNVSYFGSGTSATMPWDLHEYVFDLTGPSTLTFTSLTSGGCGPAIDNVWVSKVPAALGRTSWQMYRTPIVSPVPNFGTHGNIQYYAYAPPIPAVDANVPLSGVDGGWTAAPNGSTIGFGSGNSSRLSQCWVQADFTFFQTLVDIPAGTTNFTFSIAFSGMDDGSRVSIFNSKYPLGLVVAGSYVFLGGTGTSDLAPYVVVGETNRVVITQMDDCPVGNNLQSATVNLNGTVIPPNTPPSVSANSPSVTLNEGLSATNSGSYSDSNTGDNVTITASAGTVTKIGTNSGTWNWSNAAPDGPNVSSVTITANDGKGGSATTTFGVTINNVAPTATINAPATVNFGGSFTVSLSAPQDVAADLPGLQYAFDCDDGSGFGALSGSASRNCPATGTQLVRAVKAKVQDKDGGSTTYSAAVNIVQPPLVSAGGPYNVNEGASITLSGSCNACVSFAWDLDNDGQFDDSTSATPTFSAATLDGPSTRTVRFRGTGSTGLTSDAQATVNVLNVAPVLGTGKVVANNDEWTFTDFGFSQNSTSATQFIRNVANYFTGGNPGKFLAYSENFGLAGTQLANAVTSGGHTWTVSTSVPFTLANLLNYDGVFLSASVTINGVPVTPNNQVLIDYVKSGGNVYVAAGTGCCGGAAGEAGTWNTFLGTFGLHFDSNQYNGIGGNIAPVSAHPLLANVSTLYFNNGNSVSVTNPAIAQILFSTNGQGMLGVAAIGSVSANSIAEGQSTTLNAGFADPGVPDSHVVTLVWGDGQTSTLNLAANVLSFSAAHQYNDNGTPTDNFTIDITVTDKDGAAVTKSTAIQVTNVAPTATFNAPAVANAGANFSVSLTSPLDPSSVDTSAGFKYAFDCGTGYGAPGSSNTGSCTAPGSGPVTVKGKIQDKDGGFTEYSRSVKIILGSTLTLAPASGTYGGNTTLQATLTSSGNPLISQSVTFTLNGSPVGSGVTNGAGIATLANVSLAGINAGSYPNAAAASFAGDANYQSSATTANLTVAPAPLAITANPQTKVYGTADPALTYLSSGFQFSDTAATVLTGTLTRAPGEIVGSYAITQGSLLPNSNYTINFTGNNLDITVRPVTVTANPQTRIYGAADPALTYAITAGSLVAGDGFIGSLTRDAGVNVGEYNITQGTLALSSNYTLAYIGNKLTITPATPTITWATPITILYGTALSGTQLNATASVPGTLVYTPAAGTVLSVGSGQTLSVSLAPDDSLNYTTASGSVLINVVEATFSATTPVNEGGSITLSLNNPIDSLGGFTYAFDCGTGFGAFGSSTTAACSAPDNETRTVNGRIRAADGSITNYSASVMVNNVAPIVTSLIPSANSISENGSVTLTGTFTDPGVLDTHSVIINWGDGSASTQLELGANVLGFSVTHQYSDDDPTGTGSDVKTIAVTVIDKDGATGAGSTNVTVNNVAPVITGVTGPVSPLSVGVSTSVIVNYTDIGSQDTHTCAFSWGDGATSTSSTPGEGSCADSHVYSTAGVYTVNITLTDDDTGTATTQYQYAVVYDAGAGFVTGGGSIDSPAGAYSSNPSLAGRANFGFVSKYLRGATVPTGQTEFQFKVGNLNFHSTSYEWLVIAGARAQYKGSGSINGTGDYFFLLTAIDGQISGGGGVDKFRIKIWNKTTGGVIYDNQTGADDQADPSTGLSGGSIVIHSN
jgi:hypothetical protein